MNLVVLAGSTDLQVVIVDEGRRVRTNPGDTRAFHEGLLDGSIPYRIDDDPALLDLPEYRDRNLIAPSLSDYERTPAGEVVLVPAKVGPVLASLPGRLHGALVLGTHRPAEYRRGREEPIAVGPLLARWLAARSGATAVDQGDDPAARFVWHDYLTDGDLEGPDPGEEVIRGVVVTDLIRSVRTFATTVPAREQVTGALLGGLNALKPLMRDMLRLMFGVGRVQLAANPERSRTVAIVDADRADELYRNWELRVQVDRALRRGDVATAGVYASQPGVFGPWVAPVRGVAAWLAGKSVTPDAPHTVQSLYRSPRAALSAARADVAVRTGQWVEAVVWTANLLDAALLDAIQLQPWVARIDEVKRTLELARGQHAPAGLIDGPEPTLSPDNRYRTGGRHTEAWLAALRPSEGGPIRDVHDALRARPFPTPYELRNVAVHGRLAGPLLQRARPLFVERGLWTATGVSGAPAVQPVLRALGATRYVEAFERAIEEAARALVE